MFSWPMKAATWMGVRPDCRHTNTVIWADEATRSPNREREANDEKEPNLRHGLDGRSVFEQELHHLGSVLLAGDVKRRETVLHTHTHTGRKSQERQQLGGSASRGHSGFVTGTSAFNRRAKGK